VAQEIDSNEQSADRQPRCEIGKIRKAEGNCLRPGEVRLDGSVLCVRHAELLRLEDHSETMLGEVFEMDQWLESVDGQVDELRVRRAEHHRNDLVEQIRSNRTLTELLRGELLKEHEGTT
jgi:predicted transcriptional regulator